jgi:iron(III) transport system ATP-binding protein
MNKIADPDIAGAIENPYLRIENLTKKFGDFTALREVSLTIAEGEFVCFLGPSGCGKTTLLRAIAGLDIQTSGKVWQAGRDISNLPASERDFGIVFQSYALFPNLKIARNVAYGLENKKLPRARIRARVDELLELVGLSEQGDKYPAQLSGGQQQRVALARALATSPGLLLLDEPLSALDAKVRGYLRHEIKALQRRLNVTTIMVTHDQEEALTMADRIVLINEGVIEQVGSPTQMYREPATLFVADFIGEMNQAPCLVEGPEAARIGELILACRPHMLDKGSAGVLTIRPEDIIPVGADGEGSRASEGAGNALEATIMDMEFLGSFWRARLGIKALGNNTLHADFSINAVQRMGLETGKSIAIELPPDRVTVFPETEKPV